MAGHQNRSNPVKPAHIVALRGKLTQEDFAKLMKVTVRSVQRWESGEIRPSYIALLGMQQVIKLRER